jgi:stearoyl-CoA desaturase (delta-9 desaturase)
MNLTMKFWHTGAAQLISGAFALLAIGMVLAGIASPLWLVLWFLMHHTLTGFGAIGAHSLFCHASFKTKEWVEKVLAFGGTLLCIGSPIQWAAGHTAHHDFADTEQDPHNAKDWRGLFLGRYNTPNRYSFRYARHLVKKKWQLDLHRNALLVPLIWTLLLVNIGAWGTFVFGLPLTFIFAPVLFGYLAPLFTALTAGAWHNVTSHKDGKPRDMPWFFPFMPWEWSHGSHHENPKNPNKAWKYKWLPDPTYWVIKLIGKPNDQAA